MKDQLEIQQNAAKNETFLKISKLEQNHQQQLANKID